MAWTKLSTFDSPIDSIKIAYGTIQHKDEKSKNGNSIVLFTGWKETFHKHEPLLLSWHRKGFDVFTMDFRSQGTSEDHPGMWTEKGNPDGSGKRICHVDDFDEYLEDARTFLETIVRPAVGEDGSICVVTHSMGGLIASRLAETGTLFDRMALCAPMLQHKNVLDLGALDVELPIGFSWGMGKTLGTLGLSKVKADGRDTKAQVPTTELLSHCDKKMAAWNEMRAKKPEVVLAGCSFGWVSAAMRFEQKVMDDADKVQIPTLIFQSEDDSFVYNEAMRQFVNKVGPKYARVIGPIKGAYHELLVEVDQVRDPLLDAITEFAMMKKNEDPVFPDKLVSKLDAIPKVEEALEERWPKGLHSGIRPPNYVPVPLVMKDSPSSSYFWGVVAPGAILACAAPLIWSIRK